VQIPTTLVAQVDSSIGGKVGVDLPEGKNLIGLIVQPRGVFVEIGFLRTLPDRQFRSGLAEALKCGVIRDARLFEALERTSVRDLRRDERRLAWVVARTVRVKASLVEADERETRGLRTLLNFGHTFGHALEAATGYGGAVTHGEAVAAGMVAAAGISRRLGLISGPVEERIRRAIAGLGLPTRVRGVKRSTLRRAMAQDKKWAVAKSRWVLPAGIGRCVVRAGVGELRARWVKRGYTLDMGVGIASGYATIGAIGFEGRWDYGAIGTVTNLAARLCGEARPGQILISQRVLAAVEDLVKTELVGELTLKGFLKPVPAFNVVGLRDMAP